MSNFGSKLKELRIKKNMNPKEVGDLIGVSDSSVRKYESGDRTPAPDIIKLLARIFNVTTDELLGVNDEDKFDQYKRIIENFGFTVEEYIDEGHYDPNTHEEVRTIYIGKNLASPTTAMPKKIFIESITEILLECELMKEKLVGDKLKMMFEFPFSMKNEKIKVSMHKTS